MQNLKIWNYISLPWLGFTSTFFLIFFFLAFFSEVDFTFLTNSYLKDLFLNTIILSFSSALLSALIAVPLAILITFYKFPGHNFFSWALSLSIAFPAYVYAFIFVGIFEYASPISEFLRALNISLPSIKNVYGASVIMSMALFPYIFLLTKAQLSSVGVGIFKAAKSLGSNNLTAIREVILPSLWPAVVAGMALVIFETISDFGGVSTLRVETFTVGIYDAWFGYQSYFSAAKLAGYLLLFVFFIVFISKYFGANSNTLASKTAETFEKIELNKFNQYVISTTCLSIFVLVFCIPVIQLLVWHFDNLSFNVSESLYLLFNSSILGVCAALFTVFFAMALSLSYKSNSYIRPFISIASSGYAVPGSVISAALLIVFDFVFDASITLYGVFGLILCLSLRFMTPAFNYINASLANISKSAENALSTQPRNSYKAFRLFYLPQMKPAILLSIMIVFIESIKEQPATLLLRPVVLILSQQKYTILQVRASGKWLQLQAFS
jgi:iron(III) transport system permease protein